MVQSEGPRFPVELLQEELGGRQELAVRTDGCQGRTQAESGAWTKLNPDGLSSPGGARRGSEADDCRRAGVHVERIVDCLCPGPVRPPGADLEDVSAVFETRGHVRNVWLTLRLVRDRGRLLVEHEAVGVFAPIGGDGAFRILRRPLEADSGGTTGRDELDVVEPVGRAERIAAEPGPQVAFLQLAKGQCRRLGDTCIGHQAAEGPGQFEGRSMPFAVRLDTRDLPNAS